jgi:hypothetical protein
MISSSGREKVFMPLGGDQILVVLEVVTVVLLPCKTSLNALYILWGFGHVAYVGKVLVLANESTHASGITLPSWPSNAQVPRGRSSKFHGTESIE